MCWGWVNQVELLVPMVLRVQLDHELLVAEPKLADGSGAGPGSGPSSTRTSASKVHRFSFSAFIGFFSKLLNSRGPPRPPPFFLELLGGVARILLGLRLFL